MQIRLGDVGLVAALGAPNTRGIGWAALVSIVWKLPLVGTRALSLGWGWDDAVPLSLWPARAVETDTEEKVMNGHVFDVKRVVITHAWAGFFVAQHQNNIKLKGKV